MHLDLYHCKERNIRKIECKIFHLQSSTWLRVTAVAIFAISIVRTHTTVKFTMNKFLSFSKG